MVLIGKGVDLPLGDNWRHAEQVGEKDFVKGRFVTGESILSPKFYKDELLPLIQESPKDFPDAFERLEKLFRPILNGSARDNHAINLAFNAHEIKGISSPVDHSYLTSELQTINFQHALIVDNAPLKALSMLEEYPNLSLKSTYGGMQAGLYSGPARENYVSQIILKLNDNTLPSEIKENYKILLLTLIEKGVDLPLGNNSAHAAKVGENNIVTSRFGGTHELMLTPKFYKDELLPLIQHLNKHTNDYPIAAKRLGNLFDPILDGKLTDYAQFG